MNGQSANIQQGTNAQQLNDAYGNVNNALNAQVGLTNTLTPGATTGVNAQNQVLNEQLAEAQGQGPNPATAELAQATGQNVNQEAALMAGQRGASGNVGLAARNIGQQGANTEQQSVGQAATLQAQQALAAQQAAAGIAAQQVGQAQGATTALNQAQQNEQGTLESANTAGNNAAVSSQNSVNQTNAQANQGLLGGITSGLGAAAGAFAKGGEVSPHAKHKLDFVHKMAKMGLEHFDDGGAPVMANASGKQDSMRNAFSSGAPAANAAPSNAGVPPTSDAGYSPSEAAQRQAVRKSYGYADGGPIEANPLLQGIVTPPSAMPQGGGYNTNQASGDLTAMGSLGTGADLGQDASQGYKAGQTLKANNTPQMTSTYGSTMAGSPLNAPVGMNEFKGGSIFDVHPSERGKYAANHFAKYFADGGEAEGMKAMVSPQERYLNPQEVEQVKHGADPKKLGYIFPGKDKVPGKNSLKNDTIPVTFKEEGGVVIPLEVEKTKDSDKMRLFTLKSLRATGKHMAKPRSMK
jgi:hypothetical protein